MPTSLHENSKAPTKALLVGIAYSAWPQNKLPFVHADLTLAREFLSSIGTNMKNVKVISDEEDELLPTKANILKGFEWLAEGARDGDVLFLYYSGHGTETKAPDVNPLNRASSKSLAPIDLYHDKPSDIADWGARKGFKNLISGADFYNSFGHLAGTKVNLTAVYDCCHATGAMRALNDASNGPIVKGLVPARGDPVAEIVRDKVDEIEQSGRSRDVTRAFEKRYAAAELAPEYVIGFAAAEGWESATSNKLRNKSAFSQYFFAHLSAHADQTNQEILDATTNALHPTYPQTPNLTTLTARKSLPLFANLAAQGENRSIHNRAHYGHHHGGTRHTHHHDDDHHRGHHHRHHDDEEEHHESHRGHHHRHHDDDEHHESHRGHRHHPHHEEHEDENEDTTRDLGRDVDRDVVSKDITEGTEHVRHVVNMYTQIAANPDLQHLRQQQRGLFDSLLQHAVPFALSAAQSAIGSFAGKRDLSGDDVAIHRHLPTAINFGHQVAALPEVQSDRGLFDKIFSIGMPLVLNTAQSLLGAKRGLANSADEAAQRGLFDAIASNLPGTVFNVLSSAIGGKRNVGGEDRGFFDILKKVAPIVLNVAGAAAQSLQGQRSLAFAPTDRGFFDKIKNIVSKVVNNPTVQRLGSQAINMGVSAAQNYLAGQNRDLGQPAPSPQAAEAQVRGFFGSMLQTLTPIAMGALQGAVGAIGKRDIGAVSQDRGFFDIVSQALPAVVQVAQAAFSQRRGVGEDEAAFLQRVLITKTAPLLAAAREQAESGVDRGILGSIVGDLLPF